MADPQNYIDYPQYPELAPSLESRRLSVSGGMPEPIKKLLMYLGGSDPVAGMLPGEALIQSGIQSALPAVAVTSKTLPRFQEAMRQASENWATGSFRSTGHEALDQALAWLQTRYPRFASQSVVSSGDLPRNTLGAFKFIRPKDPLEKVSQHIVNVNTGIPQGADLKEIIKTLGEEFTHARQYKQYPPWVIDIEEALGIPYEQQQVEIFGDRAAETAGRSYQKYLDLLKQQGQPPPKVDRAYLMERLANILRRSQGQQP